MAVHNTPADAANTAVRAFLTEAGEKYWGKIFNTGTGSGKAIWEKIKNEVFGGCCSYCGKHSEKLQIEHLVMFNREEYGLHHPGNVVPCCTDCNKRKRTLTGSMYHGKNISGLSVRNQDRKANLSKGTKASLSTIQKENTRIPRYQIMKSMQ